MAFDLLPLFNSTFQKYARGGFVDNVSARVPLFNWLRQSDALEGWDGAGKYVEEEVLTVLPDYMQALGPYEQINLKPASGMELVPFHTKELVFPITITFKEMEANKQKYQAINLLKSKFKQAELAFAEALETMFLGDGTAQAGKVMLGLEAIMPDVNTGGSLGGFARSTNTWLRCPVVSGAKTAVAFDNLRVKMSNIKNTCTRGMIKPDIYMTTQTVYEGYESLSFGKYTPTDKSGAIDLGFSGDLVFSGKPVVFGDKIGAGRMYALSKDALKLRVKGIKTSKDSPFTIEGPFNMMPKQKAYVWVMSVEGALTANMFRSLGKIISID
jgi:hypothetical protein